MLKENLKSFGKKSERRRRAFVVVALFYRGK
jgi:hypothetical protein